MVDGQTLLLVDDDTTTRELLQFFLEQEGWRVRAAASGDDAITMLRDAPTDVVLCDLQMPGLCGPALAHAIRQQIAPAPILLAMTATVATDKPSGYDALLHKPFAAPDVEAECDVVRHAAAGGKRPLPVIPHDSDPVIDRATFDRMELTMTPDTLASLYAFALDDAETRITKMQAAADTHDDSSYRGHAHALKGSCGMIGALRLRALAADAEQEGLAEFALTRSNPLARMLSATSEIRLMLETLLPTGDTTR